MTNNEIESKNHSALGSRLAHQIKYIATGILASCLSIASPALAENGWGNIQPAYNTDAQHATVRLEGGTDLSDRVRFYGFLDADASREDPTNLENFYGEARVSRSLRKEGAASRWSVAAELNTGTGVEDIVRLGLTYSPTTPEGTFALLKFLPYETSGDKGPQLGAFVSQQVGEQVGLSQLLEYNLDPQTIYFETEVNVRLGKNTSFFAQARGFGPVDGSIDIVPIAGFKINF